jgi:hypothetical protein
MASPEPVEGPVLSLSKGPSQNPFSPWPAERSDSKNGAAKSIKPKRKGCKFYSYSPINTSVFILIIL